MVRRRKLLAFLPIAFTGLVLAAEPSSIDNWLVDPEFDGIVDLLDLDYLKRPIRVSRLPVRYAVTTVHGKGERAVYTFEDPNCRYCRDLARLMGEAGNVTVHTFLVTFLGDDSRAKADAVWCAENRAAAWRRVMNRETIPPAPAGCQAPTDRTRKLTGMLGINLTPTVFFADGSRMDGIRPRAEIEARLQAASRSPGPP